MDNLSNMHSDPNSQPKRQSRRGAPRLGAFVTIAASLLLLFGAASRIGKVQETVALFGIDRQAEARINQEEERLLTALMIGSSPVHRENIIPHTNVVGLDPNALPPPRSGLGEGGVVLSIPTQHNDPEGSENQRSNAAGMPPPPGSGSQSIERPTGAVAAPAGGQPATQAKSYRVQEGDTWVKVSRRTLGSPDRWREIQSANPASQDGLRVGMDLVIP